MSYTHTCELPLATPSPSSCKGHIISSLKSDALHLLGIFTTTIATSLSIKIYKDDNTILEGDSDFTTGVWIITILHSPILPFLNPSSPSTTSPQNIASDMHHIPFIVEQYALHHCNSVYEQKTLQDVAKFLHAAFFSPVPQIFINDINAGFFTSWSNLNEALIQNISRKMKQPLLVIFFKPGKIFEARRSTPTIPNPNNQPVVSIWSHLQWERILFLFLFVYRTSWFTLILRDTSLLNLYEEINTFAFCMITTATLSIYDLYEVEPKLLSWLHMTPSTLIYVSQVLPLSSNV